MDEPESAGRALRGRIWRFLLVVLVASGLAPGMGIPGSRYRPQLDLRPILTVTPLNLPSVDWGDFHLAGAWHLESPNTHFGGYSALAIMPDGSFFAPTDGGRMLRFFPPDRPAGPFRMGFFETLHKGSRSNGDIEGLTRDPVSGKVWVAFERPNVIARNDARLLPEAWAHPPAMRDWRYNMGPEAIVRLADGRFIVLSEGALSRFGDTYPALLFPDDPVAGAEPMRFAFRPPEGFRPTDAAQLPDGRVLILLREVHWGLPPKFSSKLMLADPDEIRAGQLWRARTVLDIAGSELSENYEGLAIEPASDGQVALWLISDDNRTKFQRTLLLKLLWRPNEKARGTSRAPS